MKNISTPLTRNFLTAAIIIIIQFLGPSSFALTTLSAGDVSFISFTANATSKRFEFVVWKDLDPNTQIRFTNSGFTDATGGNIRWSEQYITWTAPAGGLTRGTVVRISGTTCSIGTAIAQLCSTGATTTALSLGNSSGNQIFAFQGSGGAASGVTTFSGTLLCGLMYQSNTGTGWMTSGTVNAAQLSYLPTSISTYSIYVNGNANEGVYNQSRSNQTTVSAYRTQVVNVSNWAVQTSNTVNAAMQDNTVFSFGSAPAISDQPDNSIACTNNSTSFSVTATGATSYLWEVSTDGGGAFSAVPNTATYTGRTLATLNITSAESGMNGYQYRCVVTGSIAPAATSDAATLTVNPSVTYYRDADADGYGTAGTTTSSCTGTPVGYVTNSDDCDDGNANVIPGQSVWIGAANTLWSNTANWSCGVLPTASTNVIINSSSNMPVVDITTAVCNNLTIGTGASLTVNSGMMLDIKGATVNNGSFSAIGKTTFSGGSQILPGGSYNDLEIAGTGIKSLGGATTVSGTLTLTSGKFSMDNYNLTIGATGSISGGNSSVYIVINGTGALKQQGIGSGGKTGAVSFPVGTATSFTPLSITNAGTADEFGVRVINNVFDAYDGSDAPTGTAQTDNNVDKTWAVTEAIPGGSNATLSFQWNASDELPGFDRNACFPAHYKNFWEKAGNRAATGADPYQTSMIGITSFSPFGIGSINSILPLTLVSFTGKEVAEGVALQWITSQEVNTAAFDIERSNNSSEFVAVGTVQAGTSGIYSYTDKNLISGQAYLYRLKMRDKDGKYSYSPIVSVRYSAKNTTGYSVYPNPVTGSYLYIKPLTGNNVNIHIDIVDLAGRTWTSRVFTSGDLNNGRLEIPVHPFPAGSYVLRISDKNGSNLQVTKFTVGK